MVNNYKTALATLRQRVPVGIRHGLMLLEKTSGDAEQAQVLFQDEMLRLVIAKTGVTAATATKALLKNNFDFSLEPVKIYKRLIIKQLNRIRVVCKF